jgi:HNH endonuclease
MVTDISRDMRRVVIERAHARCEYCQKPDDRQFNPYRHEVDHVTAEKHGGPTDLGNLAYACFQCNRSKGSDLASLDPQSGEITLLFHPRTQVWGEHFQLNEDETLLPLTMCGRTTARLLRF